MKIACVGGGPGGLYFAISLKLRNPQHQIAVYERNKPSDTFGWGVVFSDQTLDRLKQNDAVSAQRIFESFQRWDDIHVHFRGETVKTTGHGFAGLGRQKILWLLQQRARELDVELNFECEIENLDRFDDCDLILAADGANSRIRNAHRSAFQPSIDWRANKFVWLGTKRIFEAFTFLFAETEHGWFQVHAYRFDMNTSTFIVECTAETWEKHRIGDMSKQESVAFCERLFAEALDGHALMDNAGHLKKTSWLNFPRVSNRHWSDGRMVLLGDSAHTAHFSIGSGTKLALEDAIELAEQIEQHDRLADALDNYERVRRLDVIRLQSAARNSTEWFENISRYAILEPRQFCYSLLTRSQRVSHENLRQRDEAWMCDYERWFAKRADHEARADSATPHKPAETASPERALPAPMFTPLRLRSMRLENRVAVSPMCMYSAEDGTPNDFHLVHLGSRALGGASLLFTEMTNVSRTGRISPGCTGMYKPEHLEVWRRIVDFVHRSTPAKLALQLGHSGPKGSTRLAWDGMDEPLPADNWEVVSACATPYSSAHQIPTELDARGMAEIIEQFKTATAMAIEADFDMLEIHAAHGYLLSAFITPLLNQRKDGYGGSLDNRLRFPREVFRACRAIWPEERPMSVRISAADWHEEGIRAEDGARIAQAFKDDGVDIIHVSSGQTSPDAHPIYGRMYQTPLSDRIRNDVGIPTIAVGNIFTFDHVNGIIAAGRADLCCLARPHLSNPNWTLHAAAEQHQEIGWPRQYEAGKDQYLRNLSQPAKMPLDI